MGHSEMASGMSAIIKVVMALNTRRIPGLLGFENLNENITLEDIAYTSRERSAAMEERLAEIAAGRES